MESTITDQASAGYNWFIANGLNLLMAIIIIIVAFWLAGFVKNLISKIGKSYENLDDTLFEFLGSLAKYAILAFATIMVLERFGVTTTVFGCTYWCGRFGHWFGSSRHPLQPCRWRHVIDFSPIQC